MQELRCPNCGHVFQADETGWADIVRQVRDHEFNEELERRAAQLRASAQSEAAIAKLKQESAFNETLAEKDREIQKLRSRLTESDTEKALAVSEAIRKSEQTGAAALGKINETLAEKDREIDRLKAALLNADTEKALAVSQAVQEKDRALSEKETRLIALEGQLTGKENENRVKEASLKEQFAALLKQKDEQIEYYKDFKARQSTKMVGESLEQHCLNQFNSIRMTAFPKAYFEKDNDARSGSKGDFIFREADDGGTEFLSVRFERKNEMDETATKHKNEDFFKELDKDRREKGCEYAVLVSLLEIDNELYNNGIVDVGYRYEKMYVIRPQFFIPMITLLRNASLNALRYKKELMTVRSQQVDIRNFEENMNAFKEGFARNYRLASERFKTAIDEIDKTIAHLQKTKDALLSSENNLRLANDKAEDLSIKRLTRNAPSVQAMFDEMNNV